MNSQLPDTVEGAPFRPVYAPEFLKRFGSDKFREKQLEISLTVERMCFQPTYKSHLGQKKHGVDFRGKRDRHVAGDVIIIYAWCCECRESSFKLKSLNDCCDVPDPDQDVVIMFLTLGSHKQLFKRG